MSRNRQNNHYHYAEQYTDGAYRRRAKAAGALRLPRRAVFFAVLVLLVFGVITATFSAQYTSEESASGGGSLIVRVRSAKVAQDYIADGMDKEEAYAMTGVNADLAPTGAQTYFYSGQGNGTNWTKKAMTVSSDGFYEYYKITSTTTHQFKIGTSSNQYAYNYTYVTAGFNSTNVSQIGDYSSDNCYCWKGSTHYIIVYYPNTLINTTSNPVICASTTLPDNTPTVQLGEYFTNQNSASYTAMTNNSGTYTVTKTLTGNLTRKFFFVVTYRSDIVHYYKNTDEGTMVYNNCTNWTFTNNNKADTQLTTVITGDYVFTLNLSGQKASVTYPKYTVSASKNPAAGGNGSITVTTSPVSIGSSVTVSAPAAATGYEWVNWTVTGGSVKTGSYASGSAITSSTTRTNLVLYPYGTTNAVTLQANYKLTKYNITYNMDASPATAASGTITNPSTNSVPTNDKKTHGTNYYITSNTYSRPGYTQVGWSTSANSTATSGPGYYGFGAEYSTDAALTLYPVWKLNTPTKSSDTTSIPQISNGSMTVGSTLVSLGLDVSGGNAAVGYNNNDIMRYYEASITGPDADGDNVADGTVGLDPSDSSTFMKFDGYTPGTYTVTITVKDYSKTGVTNPFDTSITDSSDARYHKGFASATSNTATITVLPDAPTFEITVYGIVDDPERDGSSGQGKAYMVLLGNRYYFSAAVDSTYLTNHPTTNYTYEWYWNSDFDSSHKVNTNNQNLTTITFVDDGTVSNPAYRLISYDASHTYDPENNDPDPRMLAEESDGVYHSVSLYCRVTRNSVSNESVLKQKFYFIQPLIKSFEYEPMQKIFNINDQTVSLAAEYNVSDDPSYTSKLFFSHDNSNDADDWTEAESASGFIHSFVNAIRRYLFPNGPKFFYLLMNGYNSQGELIESRSEKVHTTVGTSDSVASRTLYINNTAASLKNYLVMCYYIDGSGNLCYQTAQDLYTYDDDPEDETTFDNNGAHYRVMLPSDATAVRLGFLSSDVEGKFYYGSPTLIGGEIGGFTGPTYYGYSEQVSLSASTRVITLNSVNNATLHEYYYDPNP